MNTTRTADGFKLDTVKDAEATPDVEQPYRELGLKDDEYARIREILGRRPTSSELAMRLLELGARLGVLDRVDPDVG